MQQIGLLIYTISYDSKQVKNASKMLEFDTYVTTIRWNVTP
jgi:hypothetical protein